MSAPFARSASILRGIIGRYLHLLYSGEPHAAHYRRAVLNHAWRARPAIYKARTYVMVNVVTKKAFLSQPRGEAVFA